MTLASFLTGLGLKYAEARGSKRLTPYTRGVVVCLSGLIVSQLMVHFLYLGVSNQVTFERRREAAQKAEEKKQRMLQDWAEARKT